MNLRAVGEFADVAEGRQRKSRCGIAGCGGTRWKRSGERLASRHRYRFRRSQLRNNYV